MGFFSEIIGGVAEIFSGGGGGISGSDLLSAGTTLASGFLERDANAEAAERAAQGLQQGAQQSGNAAIRGAEIQADAAKEAARLAFEGGERARADFREAGARGIEAIEAGLDEYMAYVEPLLAARQGITVPVPAEAPPGRLSPSQALMREDLMRSTQGNLARSGLRGAGRAGQAVLADVDRRFMAGAYDQNLGRQDLQYGRRVSNIDRIQADRDRQDAITQQIGGTLADTGRLKSNVEVGVGSQTGAAAQTAANAGGQQIAAAGRASGAGQREAGAARGAATAQAADIGASADTINAANLSRTIGQIGAIFADQRDDKYRVPEARGGV